MKKYKSIPVLLLFITSISLHAQNAMKLWYKQPAKNWNEALPIGNGKLAAMIFGDPAIEHLQLNEETIWAGGPHKNIIPNSGEMINQLQQLLFEKKYAEAQKLSLEKMRPQQNGMPYLPAGDLFIDMKHNGEVTNYTRELNLDSAFSLVKYTINGINYKRKYYASFKDNFVAIEISNDRNASMNCDISLNGPFKKQYVRQDGILIMDAEARGHEGMDGKIKYKIFVDAFTSDGQKSISDSVLKVRNAKSMEIRFSIVTNFRNFNSISSSFENERLAMHPMYRVFENKTDEAYEKYFKRVEINLGDNPKASSLPTDERLKNFNSTNDPSLVSLYFQYGRYLLICSSRPGGQPATLQGKWNDRVNPPWDSKYTININTEMNYWPSETTALPEMSEPLFKMIKELSVTGQQSAREMYGARGWVVHHNTDLWRITGPVDGGFYGMWPMGGAWLCRHIWEHYLYTGDKKFLNEYYDVLKGAVMFYVDALKEEPDHHWLVMAPSMSPENHYTEYTEGDKKQSVALTAGATMDNQIIFELFSSYIKAAATLNKDDSFADTVKQKRSLLPPMQIGQYGQLQEWLEDWDRPDDKHRHISHLYGLYPSYQITPTQSPQLFEAARNTLISRGDVSTGWSMGWKVNFWARMLDGNKAYKLISDQLTPSVQPDGNERGGTYNNLFDAHPPFQIDGNFGCTAGIVEMLMQSHDGAINLLPALPDQWKEGEIKGIKARGGFTIDIKWKDGKLTKLKIHSLLGDNCRLRMNNEVKVGSLKNAIGTNSNPFYQIEKIKSPLISPKANLKGIDIGKKYEYDLNTKAGKTYVLNF